MTRLNHRIIRLIALAALTVPAAGWTDDGVPAGYRAVAAEQGIPPTILYAVALTESGHPVAPAGVYRPWPWTLNLSGAGYVYATRREAWRALRDWLDQGKRSIDIGLMQVNWHYHRKRLGDPWQALDPYHNLRVGADILRDCYRVERDWWASVGCYHAPSQPTNAARYRHRVRARWQRLVSAE